ncbi:MAG: substrate-binding domain-containing protein [Chloroflexi bacterium]|nr:substrate-binding domain-containing protein [Chloroflexota bacterium]
MKNWMAGRKIAAAVVASAVLVFAAACGNPTGQSGPAAPPSSTKSQSTGANPASSQLKGKITVSGAWALYPMMVRWSEEFQKVHPGVQFDISAGGAGKGAADALGGLVDIGMVSRDIFPVEIEKGAVYVGSAIDAVVPTANPANPYREQLLANGVKRQAFLDIWITGKATNWKDIFPAAKVMGKTELHVYTRSDAAGAPETWAKYLDKKQEDLLGTGVYGDPGLAETVRKDPLGIGFNNIGFAYDSKTRKQLDGLLVVPIDVNENGKIDPGETFYDTLDALTQAIATKSYPWPPARELNLVTSREFKGVTKEFVKWVLTEGQQFAPEAGYVPLAKESVRKWLEIVR